MINWKVNPWWTGLHKKIFGNADEIQSGTRQELTFSGRPRAIQIRASMVDDVLLRHEVHEWFSYIFHHRASRWDVWMACDWIADEFPPTAAILETGSGVGFNLLWLSDYGFKHLSGFDIDSTAVLAGQEICRLFNRPVNLWVDDGLNPSPRALSERDVVVALNWTMLLDAFDLNSFVRTFGTLLRDNGVLVMDVIDSRYDDIEGNEFHTSDLDKPASERRPSEYRARFSRGEIERAARVVGMYVEKVISQPQAVPKTVYVLRKRSFSVNADGLDCCN